MLYASHYNIKAKDLVDYQLPTHENSQYWEGVKHFDLIKMVRKVARQRKLRIVKEEFQTCNDGHTLYASWDFSQKVPGMKGVTMALGYRGGNTFRYAHTFMAGARVSLCKNGMISGEYGVKKRHSEELNLYDLVCSAFDRYLEEVKLIKPMITTLREMEIDDSMAASFAVQAARENIISASRILVVDSHWRDSADTVTQFRPRTAWALYNAFTQAAKKTTPRGQIQIMRDIPHMLLGTGKWEEEED